MVKPWVKIDGGLNRRVLDRLLGAVLSHALLKPGSSIFQLAERFHPALQPFQTRELVEVCQTSWKISLKFWLIYFFSNIALDIGKDRMS